MEWWGNDLEVLLSIKVCIDLDVFVLELEQTSMSFLVLERATHISQSSTWSLIFSRVLGERVSL